MMLARRLLYDIVPLVTRLGRWLPASIHPGGRATRVLDILGIDLGVPPEGNPPTFA